MSMLREVSRECDDRRLPKCGQSVMTALSWAAFLGCLFFAVPALSAQPANPKEASTRQSTAAELKSEAPVASASLGKVPADPAICVKPADNEASQKVDDKKFSAAASARVPDSDNEVTDESASQSSAEFMKDKLKLSIGGKKGPASDEPLQCGVDEAGASAKESDSTPSK